MTKTGLAVLALLLAACGGSSALADSDPNGAKACESLAGAFRDASDTEKAVAGSFAAGQAATEAKTEAIRTATIDVGGSLAADPEKMRAACVDAGVDMPKVPGS